MRRERARVILGIVALAALAAPPAAAQQPAGTPPRAATAARAGITAALGVSWPSDNIAADVYGHSMSVAVQTDVRLFKHVAVFAGFKSIRDNGQSVVLGPAVVDERYVTSLRVTSVRLGGTVAIPIARRLTAAGSVGVGVNWFEERWPYAQATANGHPAGIVAQGELRYLLRSRWGVVGRVEYASIIAQAVGPGSAVDVNLGGLDLSAGIRMGF